MFLNHLSFEKKLHSVGLLPLTATGVDILQMNITKQCNMACRHCHVEATPDRQEMMSLETLETCLDVARRFDIGTVDITGGAPELHPQLPWLLRELSKDNNNKRRVIVRTNLLIMLDDRFSSYLELYRDLGVEIVVSLPDYRPERTERQRGSGVFDKSLTVLKKLNAIGYGREDSGFILSIAHNPAGAYLPGNQSALESEYRHHLYENYGVEFNQLYVITNCPIGRYRDYLIKSDNYNDYMQLLHRAFNPVAVSKVMCRHTLSVGWDGALYDCDFNQVLQARVNIDDTDNMNHISQIDERNFEKLASREIVVRDHCYACCAGAGSSCQGTLKS